MKKYSKTFCQGWQLFWFWLFLVLHRVFCILHKVCKFDVYLATDNFFNRVFCDLSRVSKHTLEVFFPLFKLFFLAGRFDLWVLFFIYCLLCKLQWYICSDFIYLTLNAFFLECFCKFFLSFLKFLHIGDCWVSFIKKWCFFYIIFFQIIFDSLGTVHLVLGLVSMTHLLLLSDEICVFIIWIKSFRCLRNKFETLLETSS